MKIGAYSVTELELAAKEILEELDGREYNLQQRQYSIESMTVEQFVRIIAAAAEQMAVEKSDKQEASAVKTKQHPETESSVEMLYHPGWTEEEIQELVRSNEMQEKISLQMRSQLRKQQSVFAEENMPIRELKPFGSGQQQLYAISDWIERDSRRYDSKFTIF